MTGSSLQVALFVPNLIGYARVLSALAAFYVAFDDHVLFAWLYSISMGLDAVDGVAARAFKQSMCLLVVWLTVISRSWPSVDKIVCVRFFLLFDSFPVWRRA